MAELLLELFSEEIPARMQAKAEADLRDALTKGLTEAGVEFGEVTAMSGPRRLAVAIDGLPQKSADVSEEKKGPKVGAPDQAVQGFLRGAGLSSIDEAEVRSDPKKGDFYVAVRNVPGRPLSEIIAELVPTIVRGFHWPKSMRWGRGELRWVRPLQRIVCVFDGKTVDFEIDGLKSGNETEGHRVQGRGPFKVTSLADYQAKLESEGSVVLTREDRRLLIDEQAHKVCAEAGLELVEDQGLLEEVTGLAEWPVVILGDMDPAFLDLPGEVIQLSMRTHQKYFAVRDPKTGKLAPNFVVVANVEAKDGGKAIAAGNRKVLSARLDDARFFWDNDRNTPLREMTRKLSNIDFKKELGSLGDKVARISELARESADTLKANRKDVAKAALLAKADLVSGMVGEFPELQGVVGGYYAELQGEDPAVAAAIAEHYRPQGPSDAVPTEPVSIAVAIADKIDNLIGFWGIKEKPTGSKDPFALRRAALGVVRIIVENGVRLPLLQIFSQSCEIYLNQFHENRRLFYIDSDLGVAVRADRKFDPEVGREFLQLPEAGDSIYISDKPDSELIGLKEGNTYPLRGPKEWRRPFDGTLASFGPKMRSDLLAFFADRLKQVLRDQGARYDLIDAVFALGEDDLVLIVKRVEALGAFLASEDGENLLAGYKRAVNILKAEEKKDGREFAGAPNESLFEQEEEKQLHAAIEKSVTAADAALKAEDFERAMVALSSLRGPVDAFFENIQVNADRSELRQNRLLILNSIRDALHRVADFSKING